MDKAITDFQKKIIQELIPLDVFPQDLKEDILNHVDFRRELTKESDRGCALLAASHLDYLLEQMLRSKLIGTKKHLKSLFDFNGPLGTFSSRTLMSYSIGLISKIRMGDLQTIRKIRNDFGHSPSIISFENERIKSLCNNLKMIRKSNKDARSKFITSVFFVSGGITAERFNDEKFKSATEVDIEGIQDNTEEFMEVLKNILNVKE